MATKGKEKTCEELIRDKVDLVKATTVMTDESFEQLLAHMILYCKLEMSLKEAWSDGMSLFGIKNYKDQRYSEFKRVFNLLKKIINKQCNCWNQPEQNETDNSKTDWNITNKW